MKAKEVLVLSEASQEIEVFLKEVLQLGSLIVGNALTTRKCPSMPHARILMPGPQQRSRTSPVVRLASPIVRANAWQRP
jgi:hypothetical protein